MVARCKCCGQLTDGFDAEVVIFNARLSHLQAAIFRCLAAGNGQYVSWQFIAARVYANDPHGGPTDAANVISQLIHRMRSKLRPFGVAFSGHRGTGGGYRLELIAKEKEAA
jgi:DNA-binding response OmpR family regulator